MDVMWANSFQEIPLPVYTDETLTTEVDASTFVEAEYRIYEKGSCTVVFSASLGGGLTVPTTQLLLTTQESDISVSGEYTHSLRVATSAGELGPPVFETALTIIPVCPIP